MPKPFKGVVNIDVRNSVPDWTPFPETPAWEGAPNVLLVLYDDTGMAAWSPYGGRINMPRAGGPPAGLMAHMVRPDGEGFVIIGVWRSEPEMRQFNESVVLPGLDEVSLVPGESTVWPLWGFAAP